MGGIDVFTSGNEGYPCFRIPAALRLPGLILLFAEGRRGGDTGPNDVVYKSSNDEGLTWSPLHVLHSEWKPPGHSWHTFSKNSTFPTTHEYFVRDGYFSAGHDWVKAENATLSAAKVRCSASADCIGFCFNAYDRAPPATQLLHVYYKVAGASFLPEPSTGSGNTIHNPCPMVVGGRALIVFGRNRKQLLAVRALDARATTWGPVKDLTRMVFNASEMDVTPGPGAGVALTINSGERLVVPIGGTFHGVHGGATILSDDGGDSWRLGGYANHGGAEAQVAPAPNGSLLLNSRGPYSGVRWQSVSDDAGETWSLPRVLDFGFGSSCEGSIIRYQDALLLAHSGRVHDKPGRWNMTVWRSDDSGGTWPGLTCTSHCALRTLLTRWRVHMCLWYTGTWRSIEQVERGANSTFLSVVHEAYVALLASAPRETAGTVAYDLAYERGPMGGSHVLPSKCGEYATIRWHRGPRLVR